RRTARPATSLAASSFEPPHDHGCDNDQGDADDDVQQAGREQTHVHFSRHAITAAAVMKSRITTTVTPSPSSRRARARVATGRSGSPAGRRRPTEQGTAHRLAIAIFGR